MGCKLVRVFIQLPVEFRVLVRIYASLTAVVTANKSRVNDEEVAIAFTR
jgi:hypothetical protein